MSVCVSHIFKTAFFLVKEHSAGTTGPRGAKPPRKRACRARISSNKYLFKSKVRRQNTKHRLDEAQPNQTSTSKSTATN